MKRIVLCVEGDGEVEAMPLLIRNVLAAKGLSNRVCVDSIQPFRVGGFFGLLPNNFESWKKKVQAAMQRKHAGGVLLILDSDVLTDKQSRTSCPIEAARQLVQAASIVGAGTRFPLQLSSHARNSNRGLFLLLIIWQENDCPTDVRFEQLRSTHR